MQTLDIVLVSIAVVGVAFVLGYTVFRAHPAGSRLTAFDTSPRPSQEEELDFADRLQMLEALNDRRRRQGLPELTEDQLERASDADTPPQPQ